MRVETYTVMVWTIGAAALASMVTAAMALRFPLWNVNLVSFAGLQGINGLWLAYISYVSVQHRKITYFSVLSSLIIVGQFLLTFTIGHFFAVQLFDIRPLQIGFCFAFSIMLLWTVTSVRLKFLDTRPIGLFPAAILVVLIGSNFLFYFLQYSGRVVERIIRPEQLHVVRKAEDIVISERIGCRTNYVHISLFPTQQGRRPGRSFPAYIQIDSNYPKEMEYVEQTETSNLLSHPGSPDRISITFHKVGKQFQLPGIRLREHCPYFPIKHPGCLVGDCSACIEPEGF